MKIGVLHQNSPQNNDPSWESINPSYSSLPTPSAQSNTGHWSCSSLLPAGPACWPGPGIARSRSPANTKYKLPDHLYHLGVEGNIEGGLEEILAEVVASQVASGRDHGCHLSDQVTPCLVLDVSQVHQVTAVLQVTCVSGRGSPVLQWPDKLGRKIKLNPNQ